MNPKLSIIAPIYKTEQYLPVCIESILGQSFSDFELILVNDGSPDNSRQICENYQKKDSRIRIVNKENGGLSSARNAGLEIARGDYIMFVDSDDYLEAGCFERAYTAMMAANADLYIGGFYEVDGAGQRTEKRCVKTAKSYTVQELMNQYGIDYPSYWVSLAWGKLFRADIIKRNSMRFDTWFNYKEDAPFLYTYLRFIDKVYFDAQPICNYRVLRDGSLNTKIHKNLYEINCKVYKLKRELMIDRNCTRKVYNHVYFCSLINSMEYYYISDHPDSVSCRKRTIDAVCTNEILPQISLQDVRGIKRKLMLVLCKMQAKRTIAMVFWLHSRIHR